MAASLAACGADALARTKDGVAAILLLAEEAAREIAAGRACPRPDGSATDSTAEHAWLQVMGDVLTQLGPFQASEVLNNVRVPHPVLPRLHLSRIFSCCFLFFSGLELMSDHTLECTRSCLN